VNNKIKSFVRHPLFSGSLVMVGGSLGVNAINYLYHLLMGRILGPVNYGILASIFSILYMVSIVPQSTSFTIVKFISSSKSKDEAATIYSSVNKFIFWFSIAVSLLIVLFSTSISRFLKIENNILIVLVAPILFFSLITLVNQASSQGLLRFLGVVIPNLVSAVVKLVVGLLFIYLGLSVLGAIWAVVLGSLLAFWVSLPYVRNLTKIKVNTVYDLKPILTYAFPVLLQALAFTSLFTTDVILVKHFFSPHDAGIYAALSTLGKIIFFASSPITATMFPIVSGKKAKGENYIRIFTLSLMATLAVSLAVVVFYSFFPNIAIGILYGKAYLQASTQLIWMGFFILLYSLAYLLINFVLSLGKTKIVVLPAITALLQIVGISIWHNSLLQIIQVSLILTGSLVCCTLVYLGYNRFRKSYAK